MATIKERIDDVTEDVTQGKTVIASAITEKGVETTSGDTFVTMSNNIKAIESSGIITCTAFSEHWQSAYKDKKITQDQIDAFEMAKQAYADGKMIIKKGGTYDVYCTPLTFINEDDRNKYCVIQFSENGVEMLETFDLSTNGTWTYSSII